MYKWKARRLAEKHDLGHVVAVCRSEVPFRSEAPFRLLILRTVPLVIFLVSCAYYPGLSLTHRLGAAVLGVVAFALAGMVMTSDRLIVCQNGVLIGTLFPGFRPYVIRWRDIDITTIAFLKNFKNVRIATGNVRRASNRGTHVDVGVSFAGPLTGNARPGRWGFGLEGVPDSVHGGNTWFFPCGSRRVALLRKGFMEVLPAYVSDAERLESLRVQLETFVELSDDPRTAATQIPGYAGL